MKELLKAENLGCGFNNVRVLEGITFEVARGGFIGIIGPNASGKSTLLRTISGILRPWAGEARLEGQNIHNLKISRLAQKMAVVPQGTEISFDFTVEEIIFMGRAPHRSRFQRTDTVDMERVQWAMEATGTLHLRERLVTELSGGERQKVLIAQALAQEPEIILLDEPTSHLDINHQVEILDVLKVLNREKRLTVVITLHDLNLAAQYCSYLLLLSGHRILVAGSPEEVITAENIKQVYGNEVFIGYHPTLGCPQVTLSSRIGGHLAKGLKIHLVAGGGMSSSLMRKLVAQGYEVTTGVLNQGDGDWMVARELQVTIVDIPAFVPVDDEFCQRNLTVMCNADAIVIGDIPFGMGNLGNLKAALQCAYSGIPVIILEKHAITKRDYTGGIALEYYQKLLKCNAVLAASEQQVMEYLEAMTIRRRPAGASAITA